MRPARPATGSRASSNAATWRAWSRPRARSRAPPGERVKTDRRDAELLVRLLLAGKLHPVRVPGAEEEALRDLVRAREAIRTDLMRARHRLSGLLLRHGIRFEDGSAWTERHRDWLATITLPWPAEHGQALVVNLASLAGKSPQPWLSVYSATKAAVIAYTNAMNKELNAEGVKSVALCPGFVDTDMSDFVKASIPAEEMLKTSDVAEALRFLLRVSSNCVIPEIVFQRPSETI